MSTKRIIYFALLLIIFIAAAEITLRAVKFYPWKLTCSNIKVEPGGKLFTKDALLGYRNLPGRFKITMYDWYTFHVTNLPNSLRITHPLDSYTTPSSRPEIWIFGCSFTYGWTLNDQETSPWLLQKEFPDYEVVNFAVCGYSTLQSLLQLKEALAQKKPDLVIITYAAFHDERNTFLRSRRKNVAPWNRLGPLVQPYAILGPGNQLRYAMAQVEYSEFPLMRHSSLIHWIENRYNEIEERLSHSHEVSKAMLGEIARLCKERGITLVVAGIISDAGTKDMLHYCQKEGILATDISINLSIRALENATRDGHPSARGNEIIAGKLSAFLKKNVFVKPSSQQQ